MHPATGCIYGCVHQVQNKPVSLFLLAASAARSGHAAQPGNTGTGSGSDTDDDSRAHRHSGRASHAHPHV